MEEYGIISLDIEHENMSRFLAGGDHSMELKIALVILSDFLRSKKKKLRHLINDPSRLAFARTFEVIYLKLKKDIVDSRFFPHTYDQNRVLEKICQFKKSVDLLIDSNSNVIIENDYNYSLFDCAITTGCENILRNFFNYGFNVNVIYNSPTELHCIPLHRAAQSKQTKVVELFIRHGAYVNIQNHLGKTALFYASQAGDLKTVLVLLNNEAEINDADILTAGILSKSLYLVQLLLQYGADVNQRDLCGRTPLHFVSGDPSSENLQFRFEYDDFNRAEIAATLILHGAEVDARTTSGITPLHAAAVAGYSQVVQTLLINGAEVDMPLMDNKTALFYASYNIYPAVARVLLNFGADINVLDEEDKSALHIDLLERTKKYIMICNEFEHNIEIGLKITDELINTVNEFDPIQYNLADFNRQRYAEIIDILEQHTVKMISATIFVREEVKKQIKMEEVETFEKKCQRELTRMNRKPLLNNLTALDIMKMDLDRLSIYTRNPDIRDILLRYDYLRKYPLYGKMIKSRIDAAIKRRGPFYYLQANLGFLGAAPHTLYSYTDEYQRYLNRSYINDMIHAFDHLIPAQ